MYKRKTAATVSENMQLFHFLIVSVSAIGYAPVPQLPAAPSPYGSPLAGVVFPQSRSNVFAQQTPYPNSGKRDDGSKPFVS